MISHYGPAGPGTWRRGRVGLAIEILFAFALSACGTGTRPPPEAGFERGAVPVLAGMTVAVLPVQYPIGGGIAVDRELEYALGQIGPDVDWIFPGALRAAIERNPGLGIEIDRLAAQSFLMGEIERVGEPLFGELYRIGGLTSAIYALLPVEARPRQGEGGMSLQLRAAVLELRSGTVLWSGVVEGVVGERDDQGVVASAAESLARRVTR